jgi:CubicO group peptidase (beta-lactamase class C family)
LSSNNFNKIIVFVIIALFFEKGLLQEISAFNQMPSIINQENTIKSYGDGFDEEIMFYMEKGHMPSLSACIVKNDSVLWSKGYGFADINKEIKATENTIYLIASITKTITATAIMQLWEQGLFDLDDDVNDYLPFSLRNPKYPDVPITFRMLLAHHSSLSEKYLNLFIYFSILKLPIEFLEQLLVPGGKLYRPIYWADVPPGEQLVYSSIGIEVLGYLVELLSGKPLEKYCKEHIFGPLDMQNTSFEKSYFDIKDLARPYIWVLNRTYIPLVNFRIENSASGGIRSSVIDLSHFLIANMNGGVYKNNRILEDETVQLMRTRQYPGNDSTNRFTYGLGWRISVRYSNNSYGHSGAIPGALTYMYYFLEDNTGIIFFTNQHPIFNYYDIWSFLNILWLLHEKANQL